MPLALMGNNLNLVHEAMSLLAGSPGSWGSARTARKYIFEHGYTDRRASLGGRRVGDTTCFFRKMVVTPFAWLSETPPTLWTER